VFDGGREDIVIFEKPVYRPGWSTIALLAVLEAAFAVSAVLVLLVAYLVTT
jgi:hypothetical protein